MVSSISQNTYVYNGDEYRRRSKGEAELGAWVALAASGAIKAMLPSFSNPFLKQMSKEHGNNQLYKDVFQKAVNQQFFKDNGVNFVDTTFRYGEEALYRSKRPVVDGDIKAGFNACYIPSQKIVKLNSEKATISGFHELGHAMNHLQKGVGHVLQKLRGPGYTVAGLMGVLALTSRPKPKEADRNIADFILDNSGKIAFIAMLPTVFEEALASYKGVKLAKSAGLTEPLLKNLRKFYGKALLSYAGYALITGVSVFATSKIMQGFTRPKKIEER